MTAGSSLNCGLEEGSRRILLFCRSAVQLFQVLFLICCCAVNGDVGHCLVLCAQQYPQSLTILFLCCDPAGTVTGSEDGLGHRNYTVVMETSNAK